MGLPQLGSCLGTLKSGDYWQLPNGKLIVGTNELAVITENADPAGFSIIGFTSGKLSWKDANGNEKCLAILRVNAKGDGEWYLGCYSEARYQQALARGGNWIDKALDYAMEQVGTLNPDGLELRVPLVAEAGGAQLAAGSNVRTSANGRFVDVLQDDGNEVTYDTHLGAVGDPNAAVYGTFNGHIRDMAP